MDGGGNSGSAKSDSAVPSGEESSPIPRNSLPPGESNCSTPGTKLQSEDGTKVKDARATLLAAKAPSTGVPLQNRKAVPNYSLSDEPEDNQRLFKLQLCENTLYSGEADPAAIELEEYRHYRTKYDKVANTDRNVQAADFARAKTKKQRHGCCVYAASVITEFDISVSRGMLQDQYWDMLTKYAGLNLNCSLGCTQKDHYHVTVLVSALKDLGYFLKGVHPRQHNSAIWKKRGQTLLVIGRLNYNFQPWCYKDETKSSIWWETQQFMDTKFGGLGKIKGEHDDQCCHVVVVKDGKLHCPNLLDWQEKPFAPPAASLLPMTVSRKDGQYRIKSGERMAYLSEIRRVYICSRNNKKNKNVGGKRKVGGPFDNCVNRYAFKISAEAIFTAGMIDLPPEFSVCNYQPTYKKNFPPVTAGHPASQHQCLF